jgi:hypothetical protein
MTKIHALSKEIKGNQLSYQLISGDQKTKKISAVITELEHLPKSEETFLYDLQMRETRKELVHLLLDSSRLHKKEMGWLLKDFTDDMQTRMREADKYAVGLLLQGKMILCHSSFAGETITPDWKTIPRMLDTGNVRRYASFENTHGSIRVRYWERDSTQYFTNWLGLPRKAGSLSAGMYRIQVKIDGVVNEFQLDDIDIETFILKHPEFSQGVIELKTAPKRLTVDRILMGQREFHSANDFIQAYEAQKNDIPFFQKEYERLNDTTPFWIKCWDGKTEVVRSEAGNERVEIHKPSPGDLVFANGNTIHLQTSYLMDIVNRFVSREAIQLVHVGMEYRTPPFHMRNLEVHNFVVVDKLTELILNYFAQTTLQDTNLSLLVEFTLLRLLARSNTNNPLAYLFHELSREIANLVSIDGTWVKLEDTVIEYKSADYFFGNDHEIIQRLYEDMKKKLAKDPFKIYLVGVENDGGLSPLHSNKLGSDRPSRVESGLQELLGKNLHLYPIIKDNMGLVVLTVLKE